MLEGFISRTHLMQEDDNYYDFVYYYLHSTLCRIARQHYILHVRMNILMLRGYLLIWLELTST